ncbi:Pfs, NACHT and WD domain protein, partial [Reticulomyxa filosa]
VIEDTLQTKVTRNNELQKLFHEMIKNGYLCDLSTTSPKESHSIIKKQMNYNVKDENGELILNDKILTILNELKILYHDDIHKRMGYPLQLYQICAILLYCGKSCNVQFSYDQIQFRHHLWPYLDWYLIEAIAILHSHERREESDMELYCGLKGVRLENKEIKSGFFISHVSTSDDIQVAKMYRNHQGCILHFHPSMRRAFSIFSCDISWISSFKHEREILFARPVINFIGDEKTHKEEYAWNAKVESEDEYTQMILLTWARYDQFIQQALKINARLYPLLNLNLIYVALENCNEKDINEAIALLSEFEEWKLRDNNEQKYKEEMHIFLEKRCYNHNVNLFYMFLTEKGPLKRQHAMEKSMLSTVNNGLPFVEKDNDNISFFILPSLPVPLYQSQCVVHNYEILIFGDYCNNECYSYHTIKCKYKRICSYPSNVKLNGHCVIKLMTNNNSHDVTLLSFGGYPKHTLMMKYVSVWNDIENVQNEYKENNINEWMPFIDNNNELISIGRDKDDYLGLRAMISGNNNHLLFITYFPNNISVFNLNTFQYVKHSTLPTNDNDRIRYHCFVSKKPSKKNTNQNIHEMMLFHKNTGLSIEYDENYNIFQFYDVRVCTTLRPFCCYGFVYVNDCILFFGGYNETKNDLREVYQYSIVKDQWIKFKSTLPMSLNCCTAILSGDQKFVYIIGGYDENKILSVNMKTIVKKWMSVRTEIEHSWIKSEEKERDIEETEKEKKEIENIDMQLKTMEQKLDIQKLKKTKEISTIMEYWIRSYSVKMGWINEFNAIVARYVLMKQLNYGELYLKKEIGVLKGHSNTVNDAQFSPDGNMIVSCSDDQTIILWNVSSLFNFHQMEKLLCLVRMIEQFEYGSVHSVQEVVILEELSDSVAYTQFSPNGQQIMAVFNGHSDTVNDLQFFPDNQTLASCSTDNTIRIWDVELGVETQKLKGCSGIRCFFLLRCFLLFFWFIFELVCFLFFSPEKLSFILIEKSLNIFPSYNQLRRSQEEKKGVERIVTNILSFSSALKRSQKKKKKTYLSLYKELN